MILIKKDSYKKEYAYFEVTNQILCVKQLTLMARIKGGINKQGVWEEAQKDEWGGGKRCLKAVFSISGANHDISKSNCPPVSS